jgi:hypothetical protein
VKEATHCKGHTLDLVITKGLNVSDLSVTDPSLCDKCCVFFKSHPGLCARLYTLLVQQRDSQFANGLDLIVLPTVLSIPDRKAMLPFAIVSLLVTVSQGCGRHSGDPDTAVESSYGSLWPLPQKVRFSSLSLEIRGSTFQIRDADESSAGPSCSLLKNAYRRYIIYHSY